MSLFGKKYEYKVYVDGMSCGHCSARVEAAFNEIKGVSAKVNLEEKITYLTSKKELTADEAKTTVEGIGFTFVKFE